LALLYRNKNRENDGRHKCPIIRVTTKTRSLLLER
jgi:hypothetical protein